MRRSRRRGQPGTSRVQVVLPLVVVRPHSEESVTITVDGQQVSGAAMSRAELGQVLGGLAEQAGGPIRVEVHEPDGTRYADIITPPPAPLDRSTGTVQKRRQRRRHGVEVAGGGFLPGETVLVAVTVRTETAGHTGRATVRLDHRATPDGAGSVLMFGAISSTLLLAESS